MARPTKTGLDYFNLDCDFFNDPKVTYIERKHGAEGLIIILKLFGEIYRQGYAYRWLDDDIDQFCYDKRLDRELVDQVVESAFHKELFNRDQFAANKVLTSKGIQKRFLEAKKKARKLLIKAKYDLIGDNLADLAEEADQEEKLRAAVKREFSGNKSAQRKEKKRKEKESKEKERKEDPRARAATQSIDEIFDSRPEAWQTPEATTALKTWIQYRHEIKKPITATGLAQLFKTYQDDFKRFSAAMEISIKNGWRGLFDPDEKQKTSQTGATLREPRSLNENFEIIAKRQAERAARAAAEAQNQNQN